MECEGFFPLVLYNTNLLINTLRNASRKFKYGTYCAV